MESQRKNDVSAFFEPRAVAVFGSLKDNGGPGYGAIKNMLDFGFTGKIYPVNPSRGEVLGLTAYASLDEVTGPVDLAMVIIPPAAVPGVIEQCAQKGIKAVIIGTEGFAEASEEGAVLQRQVVDIARRSGLRIIGPNTIGVVNTANGLATVPYHVGYKNFLKGGIAYCGQTGLVSAHSHPMGPHAYPLSKICDLGNKCDVNEVDLLDYLADDPGTNVIAMELEDVKDGQTLWKPPVRQLPRSRYWSSSQVGAKLEPGPLPPTLAHLPETIESMRAPSSRPGSCGQTTGRSSGKYPGFLPPKHCPWATGQQS